jgi:hypothetical protein
MAENAKVHRDLRIGAKGDDVKVLQTHLNDLAKQFDGITEFHLTTDGVAGKHTFAATHRISLILGLPSSRLKEIGPPKRLIVERVQTLIRHPDKRSDEEKKTAANRREELRKKHRTPPPAGNFVSFDGHQVPRWIAEILNAARKAGWSGSVISGYRTPEYSTSLCEAMCGAPTCPGRCAGANSNHSCPPTHTGVPYEGAVDVLEPAGLESYCRAHTKPLYGNGYALGAADLNHFSASGR